LVGEKKEIRNGLEKEGIGMESAPGVFGNK